MLVCTWIAPFAAFALSLGPQADARGADVPTAVERALIERACGVTDAMRSLETAPQLQCLDARLQTLRATFGRDLSTLTPADRKSIDTKCGRLSTFERREVYVDCLNGQLSALRARPDRGNHPSPAPAVAAPVTPAAAPEPTEAAAAETAAPEVKASAVLSPTAIGGTLGVLAAAGVAVAFVVRSRRGRRKCRTCGATISNADLCAKCRHDAAEARRHASQERAHAQEAEEDDVRRQHEREAAQRDKRARDEADAHARQAEMERKREEAAARAQDLEDASEQPAASGSAMPYASPADQADTFDPYAVLGVPHEASPEDIGAAYQQAKTKYDPDFVAMLGDDAQAHFRAKAEMVERAYQTLTEART